MKCWLCRPTAEAKLSEIDDSSAALLRFKEDRIAAFVTSFNAADVASYRIVGTKGQIHVDPAYEYPQGLGYELMLDTIDFLRKLTR